MDLDLDAVEDSSGSETDVLEKPYSKVKSPVKRYKKYGPHMKEILLVMEGGGGGGWQNLSGGADEYSRVDRCSRQQKYYITVRIPSHMTVKCNKV